MITEEDFKLMDQIAMRFPHPSIAERLTKAREHYTNVLPGVERSYRAFISLPMVARVYEEAIEDITARLAVIDKWEEAMKEVWRSA